MRVIVTKVRAVDLKPGDLFTTAPQFYWDHLDPQAVGQKVYIRTDAKILKDQKNDEVYQVTIEK